MGIKQMSISFGNKQTFLAYGRDYLNQMSQAVNRNKGSRENRVRIYFQ